MIWRDYPLHSIRESLEYLGITYKVPRDLFTYFDIVVTILVQFVFLFLWILRPWEILVATGKRIVSFSSQVSLPAIGTWLSRLNHPFPKVVQDFFVSFKQICGICSSFSRGGDQFPVPPSTLGLILFRRLPLGGIVSASYDDWLLMFRPGCVIG